MSKMLTKKEIFVLENIGAGKRPKNTSIRVWETILDLETKGLVKLFRASQHSYHVSLTSKGWSAIDPNYKVKTVSQMKRNPVINGKTLSMSTQDMRVILNVLDVKTGDRYTTKIVKDAIRLKVIKLAPDKYEGWEFVK